MRVRTIRHDPCPRHAARGECGHGQARSTIPRARIRRSGASTSLRGSVARRCGRQTAGAGQRLRFRHCRSGCRSCRLGVRTPRRTAHTGERQPLVGGLNARAAAPILNGREHAAGRSRRGNGGMFEKRSCVLRRGAGAGMHRTGTAVERATVTESVPSQSPHASGAVGTSSSPTSSAPLSPDALRRTALRSVAAPAHRSTLQGTHHGALSGTHRPALYLPTDPDSPVATLRIPVKPITDSGVKPITQSGQADHLSERSDAGVRLCRSVIGLGR